MKKNLLFILFGLTFGIPTLALAQGTPLVNIPGLDGGGGGFNAYINAVYAMFISLAALLAVVKLIVAGVKYMFSDVVTQKSEAKKDIQGALLGLVVVLAAVLILTIINPNLTNFDLEIEQTPNSLAGQDSGEAARAASEIERACTEVGAGTDCDIVDCELFDSPGMGNYVGVVGTILGYGLQISGVDYALNSGTCAARCRFLGGERVDLRLGESGQCVYPEDLSQARENYLELRREELREEFNCTNGRLVIVGEDINCIEDLSEDEESDILSQLGVAADDPLAESILTRIENFAIDDQFVSSETTINAAAAQIGADEIVVLVTVPNNVTSPDYTEISSQLEGICRDIDSSDVQVRLDNQNYIACAR